MHPAVAKARQVQAHEKQAEVLAEVRDLVAGLDSKLDVHESALVQLADRLGRIEAKLDGALPASTPKAPAPAAARAPAPTPTPKAN